MSAEPDVVTIRVGSVAARLLAEGDRVAWHERRGGFEPETLALWSRYCSSSGRVLDIGAYTGIYSIVAAFMGCRVVAFEPMLTNRIRFGENLDLNGIERFSPVRLATEVKHRTVQIRSSAISDEVGKRRMYFNPQVPFTSGTSFFTAPGKTKSRIIQTTTIDSLGLAALKAVKIDIEGAELLAIRGGLETIKRCRPALIIETLTGINTAMVLDHLPDYRLAGTLDGRNLHLLPR